MFDYTREQMKKLVFTEFAGNPVIKPFDHSFVVADPSLLLPEDAPDARWHMFFHTNFGVYDFISSDGIHFSKNRKITGRAMRPNINRTDDGYVLYYEHTAPLIVNALSVTGIVKWNSEIRMRTSQDLITWSEEKPVITDACGLELDKRGRAISNPFYLKDGDIDRMYFSCGQTFITDCGFCEPTYISYAEKDRNTGVYVSSGIPIIKPDADDRFLNLCSGCLKVYKVKDGYIGVQNGIYQENGLSRSAIIMLESENGKDFTFVKPLVVPSLSDESLWMKQFVYASHLVEYNGKFRIYFNARDTSNMIRGRECIGFFEADIKEELK